MFEVADQNEDRLPFFPALELFDLLNYRVVERVGAEAIKSVRAKSDDAATGDSSATRAKDSAVWGMIIVAQTSVCD